MALEQLASQTTFVIAAVLLFSGVSKVVSPRSTPIGLLTSATEITIAIGIIVTSSSSNLFREVFLFVAAMLFASFLIKCVYDLINQSKEPCNCFGALSLKPARAGACIRNTLLTGLAIAALFSEPASLTGGAIVMSFAVLGAILFDEIR